MENHLHSPFNRHLSPNLCAMKEAILGIHREMEQSLTQLEATEPGVNRTDQSYQLAASYWQRVKELVRRDRFAGDAGERHRCESRAQPYSSPRMQALVSSAEVRAGFFYALRLWCSEAWQCMWRVRDSSTCPCDRRWRSYARPKCSQDSSAQSLIGSISHPSSCTARCWY